MKLNHYLKSAKISRAEFADKVSVSVTSITHYLSSKRVPEKEIMNRIFKATKGKVTPNDFYNLD